jgi:hypothetical protein
MVVTVTEPWTEAVYAALPTLSLIQAYEKAAAGNAATILEGVNRAADDSGMAYQTATARTSMPRRESPRSPRTADAISSSWARTGAAPSAH